ncbi:MAG TPA: c-type cytochrome [Crocinitomix sp.]|nr:c-type cytochrome [Crocinitomix sp.]
MMKRIFNFKLVGTLMFMTFGLTAIAQQSEIKIDRPVYEDLGISPTLLFMVMLIFTIILLFALFTVAKGASAIIKQKADKAKKVGLVIAFALMGSSTFAAESNTNDYFMDFPDSAFYAFLYIDLAIVFLILYFAGLTKGASIEPNAEGKTEGIFSKWNKSLTNAVEIEDEDSILLDHDYDGIKELDNDLPPWWKYGFYITIIWAVIYLPYYHIFNTDKLQYGEFAQEMAEGEKQVAAYKAAHPNLVNEDNVELLTDDATLKLGEEIYQTNCVACHGANGGGGIGPNLTDNMWIYDGDIKGVFHTISEGAANGMISWKDQLSPDKIQAVASFVLKMPPAEGGKEPQGENKFDRP